MLSLGAASGYQRMVRRTLRRMVGTTLGKRLRRMLGRTSGYEEIYLRKRP